MSEVEEIRPTMEDLALAWSFFRASMNGPGYYEEEAPRAIAVHDVAIAQRTMLAAAKDALSDMSEGRVRGRVWHEWLRYRALQIGENK